MYYSECVCYGFIQLDAKKEIYTHGDCPVFSFKVPCFQVILCMCQVVTKGQFCDYVTK